MTSAQQPDQSPAPPCADRTAVLRWAGPLRVLLGAAALGTAGVAVWLFWVTTAVLPARDPARVPLWRLVAAGDLLFAGLSWFYLVRGAGRATLRLALMGAAIIATLLGIYGLEQALNPPAGTHFEGYLLLLSLILGGHGLVAVGCVLAEGAADGCRAR